MLSDTRDPLRTRDGATGHPATEPVDELAESLWLLDLFEDDRELIESQLSPLELPYGRGGG